MKLIPASISLILFTLMSCATAAEPQKPVKSDDSAGLNVELNADSGRVLNAIPLESAMERLETTDSNGRHIAYVALTDTDVGGLVFVDHKLLGTVSKHDAQAFYSCRGFVTTTQMHWARDAGAWVSTLVAAVTPATTAITLNFSGKSTPLSLKEVANNHALSQLSSLVDIGTNPLGILRKLNSANNDMREREKYAKTLQSMKALAVGSTEQQVVDVLPPEDVFFGNGALVMAYPRFAFEYYVNGGAVTVAQQPSFYRLSRSRTELFYVPNARWEQCTPANWKNAVPEAKAAVENGTK